MDGGTKLQHIEAAIDSPFAAMLSGTQAQQLEELKQEEPPSLPEAAVYAWSYFLKLNQTRQIGGFGGFSAISYQEMLAYFTLDQSYPESWEVELIKEFDRVALEILNKDIAKGVK